jgi:hypothetical protein
MVQFLKGGRRKRNNRRTMRGGEPVGCHSSICDGGGRRKRTNRRGSRRTNRRGSRRGMRGGQCNGCRIDPVN